MSAFSLLTIGSRAMAANYVALQTTGNNIANASVAGYSRQRVELSTAASLFNGGGYIGRGVDIKGVTRAHDQFLTREAAGSQSTAKMDQARLDALKRLEEVFITGENGVGHAASKFLNAMTDLSTQPASQGLRQAVLARAHDVAQRFSAAAAQFDTLQADVNATLAAGVQRVNALAAGLAEVNARISAAASSQGAPSELLDERDRLLSQLSEKIQAKTLTGPDQTVTVFVGDGRTLVMGSDAGRLTVAADPLDPSRSALAFSDSAGDRLIESELLGGGEMAGMLRFQNEDLVLARNRMGQMAAALTGMVNRQQTLGLDLKGQTGANLFFNFHDSAATGALNMVRPASTNQSAAVPSLTVTDPSKLQAAEYTLTYDTASSDWVLTPSSGGAAIPQAQASALGFTLSGLSTLNTKDRFLLQPVTYAAGLMRKELTSTDGIAAASPVTAKAELANQGTGSLSSPQVLQPDADLVQAVQTADVVLRFTGPTTISVTPPVNGTSTLTWTPGQALTLGGVKLMISGQPKPAQVNPSFAGDGFVISATSQTQQNNGNALALAALADTAFVGRSGTGTGGLTIADAYSVGITDIGTRVQGAATASEISAAVASQLQLRRAAVDGVNLDEEAARLIQSQQAYQASAKVLQVAQSIFDTLLQTTA
ncbi:MAG: flagellar hook-associated protein FlgK [Rubrivivax sp.]|jgi:flagellar hook-associated protein 1 FlgK